MLDFQFPRGQFQSPDRLNPPLKNPGKFDSGALA